MAAVIRSAEVAAMRAAAQLLTDGPPREPSATVGWMLAMQAQDLAGGLWGIAVRDAAGETRADIEAALSSGAVVRSWPMRGTLHLVTPRDLRLLLAVTSSRGVASAAGRRTQLGLTAPQLERGRELATELLAGRQARTRADLMAAMAERGLDTSGQRAPHLLSWLSQTGVTCLGPMVGKQQAVVLLDEWAPGAMPDREDALRETTLRYVRSHGPVQAADLAWWMGITKTEAARALGDASIGLERIETDSGPMWVASDSPAADSPAVSAARGAVRLLPPFDELLLGYTDRSASLEPIHADRVTPGANGLFRPVVSVGGRIAGAWRMVRGANPSIEYDAFTPFAEDVRAPLEVAAAGHLRFTAAR